MTTAKLRIFILAAILGMLLPSARAGFHLIEVEQVVAGLNGDPTKLAIQLRLRSAGQTLFGSVPVRIRMWDSAGANPVVVGTIGANFGTGSSGSRILFTTTAFNTAMASVSGYSSDFTLSSVPASYFTAGKITFEQTSNGNVLWSLAWGGSNYTGTNTGLTTAGGGNDADGNYGPAFGSALPSDGRGLLYQNGLNASTSNSTDYAITAGLATITKNDGTSFVVVPEPGTVGLLAVGVCVLGGMVWSRRRSPR